MKKILSLLIISMFILPAYAINDTSVQDAKYQAKLEKLRRKQEIKCIKHPETCTSSPVQQTNLTLGTAQKNIKIGTTQEEVAMALGSPNIVTVDSEGRDTWIYYKVASVTSYNKNGFDIGAGGFGGGGGVNGGGGGVLGVGYSKSGGNYQSNQKTLTIVIKFTNQKVSSFNYHMSSF
ncbi:hypothetical protein IJ732_02500 [bacterium]|nr:hypothetical protein [bacterium]